MPYFSEKAESRSPVEKGAGEVEALRQALEVERKAIDFFKKVAEQTGDPEASRIFEIVAQEEVTHYDLIQAQIDSVTNAGFWFDVGEFKMDGLY
jgi:rubrerythrin